MRKVARFVRYCLTEVMIIWDDLIGTEWRKYCLLVAISDDSSDRLYELVIFPIQQKNYIYLISSKIFLRNHCGKDFDAMAWEIKDSFSEEEWRWYLSWSLAGLFRR